MAELLKTETVAINRFFGKRMGDTNAGFLNELKALAAEEKHWFAVESAKALGWKQEECAFTLS